MKLSDWARKQGISYHVAGESQAGHRGGGLGRARVGAGPWPECGIEPARVWAGRPKRPYREFPGKGRLWRPLWRRNGPGPVYELRVDEAGSGRSFVSPRMV